MNRMFLFVFASLAIHAVRILTSLRLRQRHVRGALRYRPSFAQLELMANAVLIQSKNLRNHSILTRPSAFFNCAPLSWLLTPG